jgi:sugar lactone lactonase YvrE
MRPVIRELTARPVTTPGSACDHAEGPVWDARAGVVRWVDMLRGDLLSLDPDALPDDGLVGPERRHLTKVLAALRPRVQGGWVVATERGFAVTDADDDWTLRPVVELWDDPSIRMNEGGCDLAGGFLCGSMAYAKTTGDATLYRLDPDGSVDVVLIDLTISNGFAIDPTGTLAYYIDTPTMRVDVFDVGANGRTLTGRRPFVRIEDGAGGPDGLCVDVEGGVWVALFGGSAVRRYLADGTIDTIVHVGTPKVTACTFAGRDLGTLCITTSQEDEVPGTIPFAGTLFTVRPGVTGMSPLPFRG